jgi:hypothetical protein
VIELLVVVTHGTECSQNLTSTMGTVVGIERTEVHGILGNNVISPWRALGRDW